MTHDDLREKVACKMAEQELGLGAWERMKNLSLYSDGEAERNTWRARADAALATVREALREPSEEMAIQGWLYLPRLHPGWSTEAMKGAYRAMLAASPLAEPRA